VPSPPSPAVLRRVRRRILEWYAVAHRDFPWRGVTDPYAVLVSEVMLQQTQAARVAERFPRFMERFPSAAALAAAPERAVLAEWSGLGYNRRALSLRRASTLVTTQGWPRDPAELERLPGIGRYTARAVASLAFGVPVGVVDTNVRRWLVRRFGLDPAGPDATPAALQSLADALAGPRPGTPAGEAAAWTHATMEFGATVCTSRAPDCVTCPVRHGCPSRGRAGTVPVVRHPRFAGSRRALRGAILRRLVVSPDHALPLRALAADPALATVEPAAGLEAAIGSLEADRLVHRSGDRLLLGPPGEPGAAGTIGA
jgi:A/G-specific adenine glycosylase